MKVLLLAGGNSNEREVSLNSGASMCEALRRLGHEVLAIDPASGRSLIGSGGEFLLEDESQASAQGTLPQLVEPRALATALAASQFSDVEVVMIALHGGTGENGTIQNLLDLAGKKYTGSGMLASAVAMNKALSKRIMKSLSIPTPRWALMRVDQPSEIPSVVRRIGELFEPPLIVKPNDGGSTIGLTKVESTGQLTEAVQAAMKHTRSLLVEEFIPGREVTVSVFDGRAYPVVEIRPKSGLYDYEAKYTRGKSEYLAPAPIEPTVARQLQQAAETLCGAVGAAGLARVDFVLGADDQFFCLELNSLPGMTALSLAPMAMKCEGISYDQLVSMLLESALKRKS